MSVPWPIRCRKCSTWSRQQIEPPPRIGSKLNIESIMGMGKHNDQFIIILNIDKVFSVGELADTTGIDFNAVKEAVNG